jgi:glucose/arabinose dehydrogenase
VTGIAFDPTELSPVRVYASRREPSATDSYEGRVSAFTAPSWARQDIITGLPNSTPYTNHYTNGLAFDLDGVLYIAQGSNTDAGLAGPNYPETPLTAAILRADIHAPGFNGAITYSPSGVPVDDNVDQTGGSVTVFAPGTRNPYDLVTHSNGKIYATDNGPAGPNTSTSCTTSGSGVSSSDELNLIVQDNYYGFPNRNRGRTDPRQCVYHAPEQGNGADFTAPIHTFAAHCSCDGIAEYKSTAFNSEMLNDLVIAQLIFGNVVRADLSSDGLSVQSVSTLQGGYNFPLDVAVGPTGIIYIAEYGANRVAYLSPMSVGGEASLPFVESEAASMSTTVWLAALFVPVLLVAVPLLARRRR